MKSILLAFAALLSIYARGESVGTVAPTSVQNLSQIQMKISSYFGENVLGDRTEITLPIKYNETLHHPHVDVDDDSSFHQTYEFRFSANGMAGVKLFGPTENGAAQLLSVGNCDTALCTVKLTLPEDALIWPYFGRYYLQGGNYFLQGMNSSGSVAKIFRFKINPSFGNVNTPELNVGIYSRRYSVPSTGQSRVSLKIKPGMRFISPRRIGAWIGNTDLEFWFQSREDGVTEVEVHGPNEISIVGWCYGVGYCESFLSVDYHGIQEGGATNRLIPGRYHLIRRFVDGSTRVTPFRVY